MRHCPSCWNVPQKSAQSVAAYRSVLTISPLSSVREDKCHSLRTRAVTATEYKATGQTTNTSSTNVNVIDLSAPVVELDASSPTIQTVGDSLHLTCTATTVDHLTPGAELTVEWTGGNGGATQIETAVEGTTVTRTLTFSSLSTTHGAKYTCQAAINIPSINVTRNNSSNTDVYVRIPSPMVAVTAQTATELVSGSGLSLNCSIQPPSVDTSITVLSNWSTPGGRHNRVNAENDASPQLVIPSVETADSGDYTCSVRVTDSTNSPYILDSPLAYSTTRITVKLNVTVSPIYEPAPGRSRGIGSS
ncbi:hypothetical protein GBAR_LOCUS14204 [Geodia barretti]|uniref:Ig-like domain-containing protein n=1 Tax=Geodia barretti TaxID=519541 RepID=A0AA35S6Q0_GEOBA|nr:hypothetical protein GBAR_LOCUS14204 [Geodia barretti]